jgi:hypothetical protein
LISSPSFSARRFSGNFNRSSLRRTRRLALVLAATILLNRKFRVTVFGTSDEYTLDRFDLKSASDEEIARQRANFERRWNNLNHIRAFSSTLSPLNLVVYCLLLRDL